MAAKYGLELLAQIPIYMSIRENGDNGTPTALPEWDALAAKVADKIER